MKKCSKCKTVKTVSEFPKNRSKPDGLYDYCKACTKILNKTNNAKNRQIRNKYLASVALEGETRRDTTLRIYCENYSIKDLFKLLKGRIDTGDGCWTWNRGKMGYGYAAIDLPLNAPRKFYNIVAGHRLTYAMYYGLHNLPSSTDGSTRVIDHKCENTACINPLHLQVVTQQENVQFSYSGRAS